MRVLVRRGYSLVNDLRFASGPIYIGRQPKSHVFLPDQSVSRQHAVMFTTPNGSWIVQDLESANRTLVNGRPVTKMPLHEGDIITISDFTLEIHFEPEPRLQPQEQPLDLGDTLVDAPMAMPGLYRTTRSNVQPLHLAPTRIDDFYQLTVALLQHDDQSRLIPDLCRILLGQLDAYHAWAGLRDTTSGPLTCHGGCARGGAAVTLEQLVGRNIIRQAVQDESYILLPNVMDLISSADSAAAGLEHLRSAMAAPIATSDGTFGVIYIDNGADQAAYTRQDLDYLTLVSAQVAALSERCG
jgi:GAF domain-containing protein